MKTILVVDDEKYIQTLLEEILIREGFKVILTDGGEEAMEILERDKVDLIILDMMMPKATGQELYTAIKVKLAQAGLKEKIPPAIILTAYPGSGYTQFLLMTEEGIKKLIPKPFEIAELVESIKEAIES